MSTPTSRKIHRTLQRLARVLEMVELRDIIHTAMCELSAGLITGEELLERLAHVERRRRNRCKQYLAAARGCIRCDREEHPDRAHIWILK